MMGEIKIALDKCKSIAVSELFFNFINFYLFIKSLKYDLNARYLKRVYYLQ
jgi:hypothetical protein